MEIQLAGLLSRATPRQFLERAGRRAIDRLSIGFHPRADFLEPLQNRIGEDALRGRANIEQVVTALAGDVAEIVEECGSGLPVVVVRLVAPRIVHRHAGFPVPALETGCRNELLRGLRVPGEAAAQAIVHDDVRLQLLDRLDKRLGPLF